MFLEEEGLRWILDVPILEVWKFVPPSGDHKGKQSGLIALCVGMAMPDTVPRGHSGGQH